MLLGLSTNQLTNHSLLIRDTKFFPTQYQILLVRWCGTVSCPDASMLLIVS